MLSAIRADLDRSPWIGEGHRKIWARLRVLDGIRVARKRVLRLMRENGLLSPHRHLARQGEAHDGRIITTAPNLMWGTDADQTYQGQAVRVGSAMGRDAGQIPRALLNWSRLQIPVGTGI